MAKQPTKVPVERLANRATGVEQQLIELVSRRSSADSRQRQRLDEEIRALHDQLGDIAEQVPAA